MRDLIPLDGFSDPPFLDITPQGIDAGFSLALPNVAIGVFNLSNLSLGAGFTVPFIGQPLRVRFNFCTREQPFMLTVSLFGGGGFFGITLDPRGIQILEAAFEFGAAISIDFGVASGGVYVMAGIYFRMERTPLADRLLPARRARRRARADHGFAGAVPRAALRVRDRQSASDGVAHDRDRGLRLLRQRDDLVREEVRRLQRRPDVPRADGPVRRPPLAHELAPIDDDTDYAWRDYCEAFA